MALQVNTTLIEKVKGGDERAFEELYHQTYKHVYFLAYRICRSDDDAKEVTQLTFLQIHKSITNLRDNKSFPSWIRQIVLSKCYNLFERNRDAIFDPDESIQFRNEPEHRRYMMPKTQTRFNSDHDVLMQLIDTLPEKYRVALVLMHFEGMTMAEIRDTLKIPEGTVKSRLNMARKLLREKVEEYEQSEQIHLDFHALDPISLTALYTTAFLANQVTVPALSGISAVSILSKAKHFTKTVGVKSVLATSIGATTCVGAVAFYQAYENSKPKIEIPMQVNNVSQLIYQNNESPFQSVTVKDITYHQAKEAYFALMQWAHCEIELEQKDADEFKQYQILYDALKQSNGKYYESLRQQKWDIAFEKHLKK